jgi:branched-subunit amino acid transport protein
MTLWETILIGSAVVAALKFVGFVLPASVSGSPRVQRISDVVTIGLLASLVVIQTLAVGNALVFDSRSVAVVVAGVLLWKRVPFIIVILVAAGVAAGLRATGILG